MTVQILTGKLNRKLVQLCATVSVSWGAVYNQVLLNNDYVCRPTFMAHSGRIFILFTISAQQTTLVPVGALWRNGWMD